MTASSVCRRCPRAASGRHLPAVSRGLRVLPRRGSPDWCSVPSRSSGNAIFVAFAAAQFSLSTPGGSSPSCWCRSSPLWLGAMIRSFGIGLATAAITVVIASLAALGLARSRSRLAGAVFLLFLTPMVVPSIVIAIALFYLFAQISLVATNLGIIIGHTVIATPVVFVILLATFKGHDWRLDAAASTLGASRAQTFWRVTLPLVKGGFAVGFVTGFLQSFEELTVALFVGGGLKTTLPKQMWDGILLQVSPVIAAASVVVLVVVILMFAIMECVQERSAAARRYS